MKKNLRINRQYGLSSILYTGLIVGIMGVTISFVVHDFSRVAVRAKVMQKEACESVAPTSAAPTDDKEVLL